MFTGNSPGMDHAYEVAVKDSVFRGTPFTENDCPHDRDPDRCDAAVERYEASKYPSLVSPHAIQRGSFIHWLRNDVPQPAISDRANVSAAIRMHTTTSGTSRRKMEQRRGFLEDI